MVSLDEDICYRALLSRDRRFDGRFFTGVATTGVYCRPVCPARTPHRKNCRFFNCAAAAEAAGFRPCYRCRPEASPGTPAWQGSSASVSRALRLIDGGALDEGSVESLAERLGLGARHLRRLFLRELGVTPVAVAQTRRVLFAKKLITETALPMIQVAQAAGFRSVRRFNTVVRERFGVAPSELRRTKSDSDGGGLMLRLAYRPPLDWEGLLSFLRPRALPGVEEIGMDRYRRVVENGEGEVGMVEVRADTERECLELRVPTTLAPALMTLSGRVRALFDLDADPMAIEEQLSADSALVGPVRERPGLRVPGAWDSFELAVRAILGQQVSVAGATTLAGKLIRALGRPLGDGAFLFPSPADLAQADLADLGMPRRRAEAIRALAATLDAGDLRLDGTGGLDAIVERLCALPGVGPWTAHYIAMRGCREPDAFPEGDLGLDHAWSAVGSDDDLADRAEAWRPWRAYAVMHLWMTLGDPT
jgi:AraC family transcriptional regulator of adaptative response / DNA-3-methyladenine glycosylase II